MVLHYDKNVDLILQHGRVVTRLDQLLDSDLTASITAYAEQLDIALGHDFVVVKGGDTEAHILVPLNGTPLYQPEVLGSHFTSPETLDVGTFGYYAGQPLVLLQTFFDPYHRIHRP